MAQAAAAVAANLPVASGGKKAAKTAATAGFSGACKKLSVEIPVADESEAAALELAKELLAALPAPWPRQFTVVACASAPTATAAAASLRVRSLASCLADDSDSLGGCLLILAPRTAQIDEVERVLGAWRGPAAVLLNAEWSKDGGEEEAGVPPQHTAFARSFDAVYCFLPILIKAFVVSRQEGAVFRLSCGGGAGFGAKGGSGSGTAPWRILVQQGRSWEAVARMARRPSSTDVEVSFYNASAANSPLTQGAKFLRGLAQQKKQD